MKKLILSFAALMMLPLLASAQLGKTIPKIEYSIGGGAGAIGYIASIEKDSWYGQMNIADKDLPFGKHSDPPFGSASAGFYTDFHFTDHWGLSTGLEFAYYTFEYTFPGDVFSLTKTYQPGRTEFDLWVASTNDLYESQQVYSLQIPIMGKYMVPISRAKGHQYYVAAGFKLGFHLLGQSYIEMDDARYQLLNTTTYSDQEIKPETKFAKPGLSPYQERGDYYPNWQDIKYNPVDVLTSIDTGFRWNLGRGFGIYTGLYCDFGLLRPVALQEGKKIINYDPQQVTLIPNQAVSFDAAEKVSIFAAEAPDIYVLGDKDSKKPEYIHNDKPYIKSLHKLTAGLKIRLSFGMLGSK